MGLALKGLNLLIKLELSRKLFLRENFLLPYGTVFFLVSFHCATSEPSANKVSVRILKVFVNDSENSKYKSLYIFRAWAEISMSLHFNL